MHPKQQNIKFVQQMKFADKNVHRGVWINLLEIDMGTWQILNRKLLSVSCFSRTLQQISNHQTKFHRCMFYWV